MTTTGTTLLGRAADALMDLESPVYGDERERGLVMEAYTFGATASAYLCMGGAVVSAVLGEVALPLGLLAAVVLPSAAILWYARRRGIDLRALTARASQRTWRVAVGVTSGGTVVTLAAMLFTAETGHGLVELPEATGALGSLLDSMGRGALVGGVLGAGVGGIAQLVRRRATPVGAVPDDRDDDADGADRADRADD